MTEPIALEVTAINFTPSGSMRLQSAGQTVDIPGPTRLNAVGELPEAGQAVFDAMRTTHEQAHRTGTETVVSFSPRPLCVTVTQTANGANIYLML